MSRVALLLSCVFIVSAHCRGAAPPTDVGWMLLFDGKTLTNWKSAPFGDEGKVHVKEGLLVLERGKPMTGVVYSKGDFPKLNYEIIYEGKKLDGNDFFCTATFPVADSFCSFVAGGWRNTTVGISNVNGANATENSTSRSMEFERDRWYRFRLRVTENRLEAWIDREKVIDLDTSEVTLSVHLASRPCRPFGFMSYDTVGAIRNVRLRHLSKAEQDAVESGKAQ